MADCLIHTAPRLWGKPYGHTPWVTPRGREVWMRRKRQAVRFYDARRRQVGPEQTSVLCVGVDRDNRVLRIAFKPRGTIGFHWHGYVRDAQGKNLWSGRVEKSLGALGLLRCAGLA